MGLPWRAISLVSVATAYLVTSQRSEWSRAFLVRSFAAAWAFQFLCWAFWVVVLYPKLFSPLRHLPGPKGNNLFMGQYGRISAEPSGAPMQDWYDYPKRTGSRPKT